MAAPQVAEAILQMETWNQFNRNKIAVLCEQKGLFQRALDLYSDLKDVKRVILNTQFISPEWLTAYLSRMQQQDWLLACLQDLLKHNR
jgi:clathrin heavy chain